MDAGLSWFAAITVGALTLAQGGFYPMPVLIVGAVSLVAVVVISVSRCGSSDALRANKGTRPHGTVQHRSLQFPGYLSIAFLLIGCLNFVSSFVHGLGANSLGNAGCWLSLAVFAYLGQSLTIRQREMALDGLGWFVVLMAIVGALAAAGVLPSEGTMAADRLCILFEYSNATGIWFGMGAMVLLASSDRRLNALAPVSLFALFLTESVGALAVTALAFGVTAAILLRRGDGWRMACLAVSWLGAMGGFGVHLAVRGVGIAMIAGVVAVLLWVAFKWERRGGVQSVASLARILGLAAAMATAAAVLAIIVVEPERWAQAQGTFAERVIQIRDGLTLLATDPLLGVGPGQWAERYPAVQTTEYIAAVNHCSYLQIALDAGLAAPVVLVAALGFAAVQCGRKGRVFWTGAAAMLLAHSVFDFDLSFFALLFMTVLLVGGDERRLLGVRS